MELTGLSFRNYKAFAGREHIEIRPLTVLIGRNSSGKSAVARLPLLLGASLSERAQAPIELAGDGFDLGGSFVDIIHNQRPHGNIDVGATFRDSDGEISLSATVQFYEDLRLQVLKELRVATGAGRTLTFVRLSEEPQAESAIYRVGWAGEQAIELEVSFNGLLPVVPSHVSPSPRSDDPRRGEGMLRWAAECLAKPAALLQEAIYLGPFRQSPQRIYRFPGGLPQNVGRSGLAAPSLLAADARRRGGIVLKEVAAWYRQHLGGWILDVDMVPAGNTFSLVLRKPDEPAVGVNLVDVGTGLAQVLPVVTQRLFEQVTGKRATLEIVEQPELHLHPGAHGSLADLYIGAVGSPGARFIIETHSENFLLRIRRRVAEGTLSPEQVRVYWVDDAQQNGSKIKPIEILPDGEVDTWPKGVFSEDFAELKAIRSAQQGAGQ